MDTQSRSIIDALRNCRWVFEKSRLASQLCASLSSLTVVSLSKTHSEALTSIFLLSTPVLPGSSTLPQSYQPGKKLETSARRKTLIVRVVRKALRANFFLTTLPLHPKNIVMSIYIFCFSAGGRGSYENSIWFKDSRKVSNAYVS